MTTAIFLVFCIVYLGMILGGLPFLQLDRTGVALLGAIALIGLEAVTPEEAARSIHLPTLILPFSFIVVSAQMRLGGFYAWVTRRIAALPLSPPALLAALIAVIAVMLLLPVAEHALAGPTLALVSTLSGNLFIVGSIANIIVVGSAARRGIRIDWKRHVRAGVPVTLATLAICAAFLWWQTPAAS
jgi:Na+/H+ antiporter NhaD/arsenite permease-like protein